MSQTIAERASQSARYQVDIMRENRLQAVLANDDVTTALLQLPLLIATLDQVRAEHRPIRDILISLREENEILATGIASIEHRCAALEMENHKLRERLTARAIIEAHFGAGEKQLDAYKVPAVGDLRKP